MAATLPSMRLSRTHIHDSIGIDILTIAVLTDKVPTRRRRELATVSKGWNRLLETHSAVMTLLRQDIWTSERILRRTPVTDIQRPLLERGWTALCRSHYASDVHLSRFHRLLDSTGIRPQRHSHFLTWIQTIEPSHRALITEFNFNSLPENCSFIQHSAIVNMLPDLRALEIRDGINKQKEASSENRLVRTNQLAPLLALCPALTSFTLHSNSECCNFADFMPCRSRLEKLNLRMPAGVIEGFASFSEHAVRLKDLELPYFLDAPLLTALFTQHAILERLDLQHALFSDTLCTTLSSQCTRLASLGINIGPPLTNAGIHTIATRCALLSSLTLYSGMVDSANLPTLLQHSRPLITSDALASSLRGADRLHKLEMIYYGHWTITCGTGTNHDALRSLVMPSLPIQEALLRGVQRTRPGFQIRFVEPIITTDTYLPSSSWDDPDCGSSGGD